MITIWNFPRGARGVRAFWVCEEMGLDYRVETVTFPPSDAYRALHPRGNVPFLQDGEVAIHESVAIILYLATRYGPTPLLPAVESADYARVLELTVFAEATFGAGMNTLMAAHFGAPAEHKRNWSVAGLEAGGEASLNFIAGKLGGRDFLVGNTLTLADIAICTGLGMWRGALQKEIPPGLSAWRDRLMERPAYKRAAARQQA